MGILIPFTPHSGGNNDEEDKSKKENPSQEEEGNNMNIITESEKGSIATTFNDVGREALEEKYKTDIGKMQELDNAGRFSFLQNLLPSYGKEQRLMQEDRENIKEAIVLFKNFGNELVQKDFLQVVEKLLRPMNPYAWLDKDNTMVELWRALRSNIKTRKQIVSTKEENTLQGSIKRLFVDNKVSTQNEENILDNFIEIIEQLFVVEGKEIEDDYYSNLSTYLSNKLSKLY